jgi:hypothetical protein
MSLNCPESQPPHDAATACPAQRENQVENLVAQSEYRSDSQVKDQSTVDDSANIVDAAPTATPTVKVVKIIKDGEVIAEHEGDSMGEGVILEKILIDRLLPNRPLPDNPLSMMVGLTCTHCGSQKSVRFPAAYEWSKGADSASYLLLKQRTAIKKILHDKPATDKELLELTTPPEAPDKPSSKLIIIAGMAGILRFTTALYSTLNGNPRYGAICLGLAISIINTLYYFSSKSEYQEAVAKYDEKYRLWWQQWVCGHCKRAFRESWPDDQSSNQRILSLD